MSSATAIAHPNIALVKYWGKANTEYNIPATPSLSIALSALTTETTVSENDSDQVVINGLLVADKKINLWLERLRQEIELPSLTITSESNFPVSAGLASSASGFAALTEAISSAFDLGWDIKQKTDWARRGSASAARSVTGAWSTLVPLASDHPTIDSCDTTQIHDESYWDLAVVVAITDDTPKLFSSTIGMELSRATSDYYSSWVSSTHRDFTSALNAVAQKDFQTLAEIADFSCRKMHALMLSSIPAMMYWNSTTLDCIQVIKKLIAQKLPVFFTIDAGPQVKTICPPDLTDTVLEQLAQVSGVKKLLQSKIGGGARSI